MRNTAFTHIHESLGAKMVEFAGYKMPIQYEGLNTEHETVRNSVGVFDVSHMGEFWVYGPKALDYLQKITSNNVAALEDGKVQYSCFPNGKGGIVDDLLVYRFEAEKYLLVVNAANIDKDWEWCTKQAELMGLEAGKDITNASDNIAQLAVQGPKALEAMQKLTSVNIVDMEYYTFQVIEFAGIPNVILSTTGYTGSGGCEIYIPNKDADQLWKAIFEAGEDYGIKPIGLGARDTLRLEKGFCLYGNDINDTTSPIEAGLGWITKFVEGKDFIDRDYMQKQKDDGVTRRLRGFEMLEKGIPRQHYEICDAEGNVIGEVTSGTQSPMMKKGIGMGYIATAHAKFGSEIYIRVRKSLVKAQIVKMPIYKD
ncbi:glycine cleavage system aminomethyltransferase GcvT [Lentimicrobium sp. L6]|uniref:glycine cleavage system aminomethyltransferase GcvT n=1 Tax=Lentimicrobium sp. L6 TaxID=2735916 RepID=UPI0015562C18|nr:glycine cleavage system aminomethyltransferase GcvT [Lentimicrobium sp. L6]NPD83441.1 glycine cleavage system aminomethyltransferase GcvT [Lentimicrobium sp. L6]